MKTEGFIRDMKRSDEESETAKALSKEEKKLIYDFIVECGTGYIENESELKKWSDFWYGECLKSDNAPSDLLRFAKTRNFIGPAAPSLVQDIVTYADD